MEKIICYCKNVTEDEIKSAITQGAKTLKDIQFLTSACTGNSCAELNPNGFSCSEDINDLIRSNYKSKGSCCCCS
ncbi:MAG TPA: NAD(P)H-nitrite reductase [Bacteroidales bacterium]|jgi:bacterioferritin-associated ferredoxin|nr:NAD(P)H-nitrite reductase [Bacteroidales bacterium]